MSVPALVFNIENIETCLALWRMNRFPGPWSAAVYKDLCTVCWLGSLSECRRPYCAQEQGQQCSRRKLASYRYLIYTQRDPTIHHQPSTLSQKRSAGWSGISCTVVASAGDKGSLTVTSKNYLILPVLWWPVPCQPRALSCFINSPQMAVLTPAIKAHSSCSKKCLMK